MLELLAEFVHSVAHVGHDLQTQFLSLRVFTVMMTCEGNQTLSQSDESDTECTMIDDALDGVVWLQVLCAYPQT